MEGAAEAPRVCPVVMLEETVLFFSLLVHVVFIYNFNVSLFR